MIEQLLFQPFPSFFTQTNKTKKKQANVQKSYNSEKKKVSKKQKSGVTLWEKK